MRKKKHFKVNAKNHFYDKFYIVNYTESMNCEDVDLDEDMDTDVENEDSVCSKIYENEKEFTMCLFDQEIFESASLAFDHMRTEHHFDICKIKKTHSI